MMRSLVGRIKERSLPELLSWLLLAPFLLFITYHLIVYQYLLITFPWPLQYRETPLLITTDFLMKGLNPFRLEYLPSVPNAYGIFFNLLLLPLSKFFGPTLFLHKAAGALFAVFSSVLLMYALKRAGASLFFSWGGALFFYSSLLFMKSTLAEPDTLGVMLYIMTVVVPVFMGFTTPSLVIAGVTGLLAFYTKSYYILGIPVLCIHLFLFVSRKRSLIFAMIFSVFFGLTAVAAGRFLETYFFFTLFQNAVYASVMKDVSWMWSQLWQYCRFNREILGLAAASLIIVSLYLKNYGKDAVADTSDEKKHLFLISMTAAVFSILLFAVKLGQNRGAYMTYLFQLTSPFLLLAVLPAISRISDSWIWFRMTALAILVYGLFRLSGLYGDIWQDFAAHDRGDWARAHMLVSTARNVLNSPAVAPLLFAQGKTVYDSGHSEGLVYGLRQPIPKLPFYPDEENVRKIKNDFFAGIRGGITSKTFDLVMTDKFTQWLVPEQLLEIYYERTDILHLYMPHTWLKFDVTVWKPRQ